MYAMYDGRKLLPPVDQHGNHQHREGELHRLIGDRFALLRRGQRSVNGIDDAHPRRREVPIPVNLHVREIERIARQHPEVGHVGEEPERNQAAGSEFGAGVA